MAAEMAELEDGIDRVRDVIDDLRLELADGADIDGPSLLERLETALGAR